MTSLSAATGKQIASWDLEARHGLFTHHLLDALYGKGDADSDGKVTAREAKQYLDDWMTRAARRKHRRIQEASLLGGGKVVLTAAPAGGVYPERPVLGVGGGAAQPVARVGSDRDRSGGSASPKAPASRSGERPGPDHAAVERGLGLKREGKVLVQRGLLAMKYEVGCADGLFGKRTRGAIRKWQAAKGFEATGYLTGEQAEALKAVGGEVKVAVGLPVKPKPEPVKKGWEAGEVFRDCEGCPEMVVVPAGEFQMGSPEWETGREDDEEPRHRVRIPRTFAVGKYEVTFKEWDVCVADGRCQGYRPDDEGWGRGRRPVVNVSWEDAKEYVEWLSEKTGKEYRLLTEAEWEYAARAGTTGPFHFGSTITPEQANYDGNYTYGSGPRGRYRRRTVSVGTFPANGFGLHDVHGNVWEWVEDCLNVDYSGAPTDGSVWLSGGDCSRRVLRGGSWNLEPRNLRSSIRFWSTASRRNNYIGFRIARTLSP